MEPMLQLEGPWRHYVKWTKREENKYCEGSLICGIWKKKNLHRKRDQICDCQGMGWEMGEELDASDHKVQNSSFRITEIYTRI